MSEIIHATPDACASINVTGSPSHFDGSTKQSIACSNSFTSFLAPKNRTFSKIPLFLAFSFNSFSSGPSPIIRSSVFLFNFKYSANISNKKNWFLASVNLPIFPITNLFLRFSSFLLSLRFCSS